jgi:hypothetical protein
MENNPVIRISGYTVKPEFEERFYQWTTEINVPLTFKTGLITRREGYRPLKGSLEYPEHLSIGFHDNLNALDRYLIRPEVVASANDLATWSNRREVFWAAVYQLMRRAENRQSDSKQTGDAFNPENPPVISIEAFRLSAEDEQKYLGWLSRWGYPVYIPLLLNIPGLIKLELYKLVEYDLPTGYKGENGTSHPPYMTILTFKNSHGFEAYEKSLERAAFGAGIEAYFLKGLTGQWYVQYKLNRIWWK